MHNEGLKGKGAWCLQPILNWFRKMHISIDIYPSRNDKGHGAEDFLGFFKDIRSRNHNKFQAR